MSSPTEQLTVVSSTTCLQGARLSQASDNNYCQFSPSIHQPLTLDLACQENLMETIDYEAVPVKGTDRYLRNQAEKMRRTKMNKFISELAELVPISKESSRKIDKTGVLRISANFLRSDHVFGNSEAVCHMDVNWPVAKTFLDLIDGFLVTVTCKGFITVISPNVQNYLGYCQIDLLGQKLQSYTHPEDIAVLERSIEPGELKNSNFDEISDVFQQNIDFYIRLMRASPKSEPPQYELCRVDGTLRRADRAEAGANKEEQIIRRQRVRRDKPISSSGNDIVFVGVVKVIAKTVITGRFLKASYQEYWTRHLIDGRIVQCDQRVSIVTGYMMDEINGLSAFRFMHKDEVRWVIFALRQMYDQSKEFGDSCYRLIGRNGQFIYMKTKGFLEIDKDIKASKSFVCVNSVVSEEEGLRLIEDMKKKYSAIVQVKSELLNTENPSDEFPIEKPEQLIQVVKHLVTNLPSQTMDQNKDVYDPFSPKNGLKPLNGLNTLKIIAPAEETIATPIVRSKDVISLAINKNIAHLNGNCNGLLNRKRTMSDSGCENYPSSCKLRTDQH